MKDGSTIECIRREEPKLLLGDDGQPQALITQCSMMPMGQSPPDANGHSFGTQWWGKQPLLSYSVPFRRVLSSQIIVSQ
jgi:hypothetical protein